MLEFEHIHLRTIWEVSSSGRLSYRVHLHAQARLLLWTVEFQTSIFKLRDLNNSRV